MSGLTQIVGAAVVVFSLLWAISMRHWNETFAWGMTLVSWGLACLQQSRINDALRELDELKKSQDTDRSLAALALLTRILFGKVDLD